LRLMELVARSTPAIREDQYSLFVEQMHGRRVTCASEDQCKESLFKTLMIYHLVDLELSRLGCPRRVVPTSSKLPVIMDRTKTPFKDLNDLSRLLQRTQKALTGSDKSLKLSDHA
ncbi:hypothetical protein DXG01_013805, partial [Tephrocybe rancida]